MRKTMIFLAAMMLVASGYMTNAVFASSMEYSLTGQTDINWWLGKGVRNPEGEHLGTITSFITDSYGLVSFAIVAHGGWFGLARKQAAVPYSALTFDKTAGYAVLDISKERLADAPSFGLEGDLANGNFAGKVYRYYGQAPYWTEKGMGEVPGSMPGSTKGVPSED